MDPGKLPWLEGVCMYMYVHVHTVHVQALVALRSLCTEGCARTVRLMCVGVRNVICEFIWTAGACSYSTLCAMYTVFELA